MVIALVILAIRIVAFLVVFVGIVILVVLLVVVLIVVDEVFEAGLVLGSSSRLEFRVFPENLGHVDFGVLVVLVAEDIPGVSLEGFFHEGVAFHADPSDLV